jgi:hypothetical protein
MNVYFGRYPLARPRKVWGDNIKTDVGETRWENGRWMKIPQDHVKWTCSVLAIFIIWLLLSFSC